MLKLETNTRNYDVVKNADGTLSISFDGSPIQNAGSFIIQMGGVENVLAKCKEYTPESWTAELEERKEKKELAKQLANNQKQIVIADHEKAYHAVFGKGGIVCSTLDNISALLNYLNDNNVGCWTLPKMSIGYVCNQYDCDGTIATTIKLDKPINYDGEMVDKFQVGAPVGHLAKYSRLR